MPAMKKHTMFHVTVAAVALALAASGAPAQAEGITEVTRIASTGFSLPDGATVVGTVTAPTSASSGAGLPIDLNAVIAHLARTTPKAPKVPCVAKTAWAVSGTALTGTLYTFINNQTGYTEASVLWMTDDGDWDPETGEGVVAFASKDCATKLVLDWSLTDVSSSCPHPDHYPIASAGEQNAETDGPFTEPVYYIFGMGFVPYFVLDPSLAVPPCYRAQSTVIFKAYVSYIEKNRGTKVPIGCVQRSWPVTFAPSVTPGEDPTKPKVSWLTVGAASPEQTCASGV